MSDSDSGIEVEPDVRQRHQLRIRVQHGQIPFPSFRTIIISFIFIYLILGIPGFILRHMGYHTLDLRIHFSEDYYSADLICAFFAFIFIARF